MVCKFGSAAVKAQGHQCGVVPAALKRWGQVSGGIRSYNTTTKALVQTKDTGKLFGGTVATTVGHLTLGVDGTLYVPVFNGNFVANGLAKCSVLGAGSCQLMVTDNVNLIRPIGIVAP